eukprot:Skav218139  [mRNA]  locus=scaffold759:429459:434271:- [translate_table: standard]
MSVATPGCSIPSSVESAEVSEDEFAAGFALSSKARSQDGRFASWLSLSGLHVAQQETADEASANIVSAALRYSERLAEPRRDSEPAVESCSDAVQCWAIVSTQCAEAARLIRDKGEAVYDPKTGQRIVPPCEQTCNKDPWHCISGIFCACIEGQKTEKNVAYCQQRCQAGLQDDCAAGDGLGATENYDDLGLDIPRVSKDSEKSPGERFAEWGSEMNVQMMEFMRPPGTTRGESQTVSRCVQSKRLISIFHNSLRIPIAGLEPDSMSAVGDGGDAPSQKEAAKPLLDARNIFAKGKSIPKHPDSLKAGHGNGNATELPGQKVSSLQSAANARGSNSSADAVIPKPRYGPWMSLDIPRCQ